MGLYVSTGHPLAFFTFLLGWDIFRLGEELFKRSYILVGFIAWITLMPFGYHIDQALGSATGARWKRLHQSIYIAMGPGCRALPYDRAQRLCLGR
ncbi:MAG: hypothetical protein CM1200mP41_03580 [Gammaproteobacteria bacterium]|nr:MAG: hypothetical protein CM1200mP41_03580 [Gammaproteobacteria bacterium]